MSKQGSAGRIHPESVSNFIDKTYDILEVAAVLGRTGTTNP